MVFWRCWIRIQYPEFLKVRFWSNFIHRYVSDAFHASDAPAIRLNGLTSIQSYFDVFLLEHPWQRQFPVLVPRRYDVMPSDDVMILAPARLWRHTFRAVFSRSFLPKEFICFVFTTWLCEQHLHIVWMVPCQVNRCFIIQYIRFNIKRITQLLN